MILNHPSLVYSQMNLVQLEQELIKFNELYSKGNYDRAFLLKFKYLLKALFEKCWDIKALAMIRIDLANLDNELKQR